MADIYLTKGGVRKNVPQTDVSFWKSQGWSEETPAASSSAPAPVATPAPSTAPTTPKKATLYGPNGAAVVVDVGSAKASQLQSQGYGLTPGSYKAPASTAPVPVKSVTPTTPPDIALPGGMTRLTSADDISKFDIKGQVGVTGSPGSYLYGTPKKPATTPVTTGIPTTNPPTPELPTPAAPTATAEYLASVTGQVETAKTTLQSAYQKQLDDLKAKADAAQKTIDAITAKETTALENVQEITKPFREQLETAERERLYVNENFEANQKLTDELDSLLTDGNTLIAQMKGETGLQAIRNPRINEAIDAVNARVGVISAVMNARNGQINQAYTLIDRSVAAITADKQDQLLYYQSLLNFYGSQKTTENQKLIALTADEKSYIDAQIGMLEADVADKKAVADNIKAALINPNTALLYAQAGVTLQDSIEEINEKLATQAYTREISATNNEMVTNGYTYLAPGETAPTGAVVISTKDSKGAETQWYKLATAEDKSFTLGTNQIRYDAAGNIIAAGPVGSETGTTTGDPAEDIVIAEFQPYLGSDGFVSPETYNAARSEWTKAGLNPTDFDTKFKGFRNPYQDGYNTGNS